MRFGKGLPLWQLVVWFVGLLAVVLVMLEHADFLTGDGLPRVLRLIAHYADWVAAAAIVWLGVIVIRQSKWWDANFSNPQPPLGVSVCTRLPSMGDLKECQLTLVATPRLSEIPNPIQLRTASRWRNADFSVHPIKIGLRKKAVPILWRDARGFFFKSRDGERFAFSSQSAEFTFVADSEKGSTEAKIRIRLLGDFPTVEILSGSEDGPISVQYVEHQSDLII